MYAYIALSISQFDSALFGARSNNIKWYLANNSLKSCCSDEVEKDWVGAGDNTI